MATKKLNSQTKTDHKKCMVCKYCESACGTTYLVHTAMLYMGQKPSTPHSTHYYCNQSCLNAHGLQEQSIYLRKEIVETLDQETRCKKAYFYILTAPSEWDVGTHTPASMLSRLGLYKHLRIFYEGCLARKSAEELHLLRMKAKMYAGELLEHYMVIHDEDRVDYASSMMQSDLADEGNFLITIFAQ